MAHLNDVIDTLDAGLSLGIPHKEVASQYDKVRFRLNTLCIREGNEASDLAEGLSCLWNRRHPAPVNLIESRVLLEKYFG